MLRLLNQVRNASRWLPPSAVETRKATPEQPHVLPGKKAYCAPQARKLEPEQANLILVGRAWDGDEGAREMLEILFPAPGARSTATKAE